MTQASPCNREDNGKTYIRLAFSIRGLADAGGGSASLSSWTQK